MRARQSQQWPSFGESLDSSWGWRWLSPILQFCREFPGIWPQTQPRTQPRARWFRSSFRSRFDWTSVRFQPYWLVFIVWASLLQCAGSEMRLLHSSRSKEVVAWKDLFTEERRALPGLDVFEDDFADLAVGADGYALPDIGGDMNMSQLNEGVPRWRHITRYPPGGRRYSREYRPAVVHVHDGSVESHGDYVMIFDETRLFVTEDCGQRLEAWRQPLRASPMRQVLTTETDGEAHRPSAARAT